MRERPILMNGPMIRATLDGRKGQTRRVVTPQPREGCGRIFVGHYEPAVIDRHGEMQPGPTIFGAHDDDGEWGVRCPHGEPGDRMWVRETWAPRDSEAFLRHEVAADKIFYRADDERSLLTDGRWRPSIHMPRWASRLTLEVTGVRVERLQSITSSDARAEGIESEGDYPETGNPLPFPVALFKGLWTDINGRVSDRSWDANPYVWVIEFKVVHRG